MITQLLYLYEIGHQGQFWITLFILTLATHQLTYKELLPVLWELSDL